MALGRNTRRGRREFDGPISPFKKTQDTLIKSPLTWGTVPASYKTLIKVSCHLQHSFLQIVLYYVEGFYINRPARSKAAAGRVAAAAGQPALQLQPSQQPSHAAGLSGQRAATCFPEALYPVSPAASTEQRDGAAAASGCAKLYQRR
eukprot:COSAG01_NODE_338_length_18671_cov_259.238154_11_plen_147_part_00